MENILLHKNCGGLLDCDSFGNFKCRRCKEVFKEKQRITIKPYSSVSSKAKEVKK